MRRASPHFLPATLVVAGLALPTGVTSAASAEALQPPMLPLLVQAGETARGTAKSGQASLSESARKFVEEAGKSNLLEIQLGQVADNKAQSDRVKQFGQQMVKDHAKADAQLVEVVEPMGIKVAKQLDEQGKQKVERLRKLEGREFDEAYMEEMVQAHQKDIESFRKQAEGGDNPKLKEYAENTLPVLEEHLKQAKEISETMQGGAAGRAGPDAPAGR